MTILELPVSSLSRKILLKEYQGPEPLTFPSNDPMFQILSYRAPKGGRHNLLKLRWYLNDRIRIQINNRMANHIRPKGYQIGYHIWTLHIHQMMGWVRTSVLLDQPARHAIQRFYDYYGIEEDDFSLDSAYKRWQRFQKNLVKVTEKPFKKMQPAGQINCPVYEVNIPPADDELDDFIADLVMSHLPMFSRTDGNLSFAKYYQLQAYTYNQIGQYLVKEVTDRFGWESRTTYKRINAFQRRLDTEVGFAGIYHALASKHFDIID